MNIADLQQSPDIAPSYQSLQQDSLSHVRRRGGSQLQIWPGSR